MLSELLGLTGVAGLPSEYIRHMGPGRDGGGFIEPYADPRILAMLPQASGPPRPDEDFIANALAEGRGPNGVSGTKIHWYNFAKLSERLRLPPPEVLQRLTPQRKVVRIVRLDRIAQAVSNAKAMLDGVWRDGRAPLGTAVYDYELIAMCLRAVEAQEAWWTSFLAGVRLKPHVVVYEDLASDRIPVVQGIFRYLGLPADTPVPPPTMRRQGGETNSEWCDWFRWEQRRRGDST